MFLGIVNAPLGFNLAGNGNYNVPYVVIVIGVALLFIGGMMTKKCCAGSRKKVTGNEIDGYQDHWQHYQGSASGAYGSSVPLGNMASQQSMPPSYESFERQPAPHYAV